MLKCKARIAQRAPGRGLALSVRPPADPTFPECGGDISVSLSIDGGDRQCYCGDYCYCESPKLVVYVQCNKCRNAFIHEDLQGYYPQDVIQKLVIAALERIQKSESEADTK